MKRTELIAGRIREVLLNGRWIANTNYKDQLLQVSLEEATHKVGDLNTIVALTYHIDYYVAGLLRVLDHGVLDIKDKYSFDHPPLASEEDWTKLVGTFLAHAEAFADRVEHMPDEQLDELFVDAQYGTWLRNIEGMIEHSYYHLGQVSLIRKLIGSR